MKKSLSHIVQADITRIFILLTVLLLFCIQSGWTQDTVAVFKYSAIRLESNAALKVDTALIINLKQPSFFGKIYIKPKDVFPSGYLSKIGVPVADSFEVKAGSAPEITYLLSLPRDRADDRQVSFVLGAVNEKGERVQLKGDSVCTIYVKPYKVDSLTSERDFEFWIFTGTNFDPFDGIKAQEFFFRINTLFRISKNQKWLGQIGIYKNRYFSSDSITNNIFYIRNNPFIITDGGVSSYSYTELRYKRTTKRTVDPVGLQIDVLRHINNSDGSSRSRFFVSAGLDINSRQIIQESKDSDRGVDTVLFPRPQDDRASILSSLPAPLDAKVNFQIPNYNFNIGFMWIFDNEIANIKTQMVAGISSYQTVSLILSRGTNEFFPNYGDQRSDPYVHFRMFATAKKPGISLGFETFLRKNQFPQFGFTLSKVFDLRNFLDVLTPVSSLKLSK